MGEATFNLRTTCSAKQSPNRKFGLGYSFVVEKIVARFELGATAKPKKRLSIVFSDDRRFFASKSSKNEECEQKSKRKISSSPPMKRTPVKVSFLHVKSCSKGIKML